MEFIEDKCLISNKGCGEVLLTGMKKGSLFVADLKAADKGEICCFYTKATNQKFWLCHRKLSHLNVKTMNSLEKRELIRDMPALEFVQDEVCEACQKGKIKRSSHKSKLLTSITKPLQLIHMDLFGPVNVLSLSIKRYALVMVDDFSRYTWVEFLSTKDEAPQVIIEHIKRVDKEAQNVSVYVASFRCDNGTEFRNTTLYEFRKDKDIS